MKVQPIPILLLVFVVGVSWQVLPAPGNQVPIDIEEQVWALEQAYITAYKDADHDEILALLHDGFLGWPDPHERPTGKNEVVRYLQENYARPGAWSFEIDRAGIRIFEDVVITQYVVNASWNDDDGVEQMQTTRITHTWIKEGSNWTILGGMSNVQ